MKDTVSTQNERNIANVKGTFAAENIIISDNTLEILKKVANGDIDYQTVIQQLKDKYKETVEQ